MKLMNSLQIILCGVIVCVAVSTAKSGGENYVSSSLVNRVEGTVFDPSRRPVPDIYVELQNENYSTVSRMRTDSTGHFSFIGYPSGHYNIKVLTSGTNYLEYTEAFELVSVVQGGSDSFYRDIYLTIDKSKVNSGIAGITDVVFVQEVPQEARNLYKKGLKDINESNKGFDEIKEALKVFPEYYDALNTLGREYVARKKYQESLEYLIRSIDINQRSFTSFYALAYACYQLNHRPEGLEAARAATIIQPNSVNAQLLYGTLLRLDGSYEKAEKVLLEAEKLSKDRPVAEIHWQLALLYNKLGRNKEAADELSLYLKLEPDAPNKKEIQDLIAKLRKQSK
jgi:tetratricopeptide (TPR) repeat protein